MFGVAVLALVALLAVRWALSSPGRGAADRRAATAAAATDVAASGGTAVARAVAATLTADADALSASSDTTAAPGRTPAEPVARATTPAPATAIAQAPTPRPPVVTATSAPPTAAPTQDEGVSSTQWIGRRAEGGELGEYWRLVDTRLGRHDGFTRIVWEWQADMPAPRWQVVERDMGDGAPRTYPPGAISGTAWLEVKLSDVIAMEAPEALEPKASPGGPVVTGVAQLDLRDDAMIGFAVGLARPARFEAAVLDDPARLVLDVFDSP